MIELYYRSLKDKKMAKISQVRPGAWVNIVGYDQDTIKTASERFDLDSSLVSDGVDLYEAPRIEHLGEDIYLYIRYCNPANKTTSTEPLLIIIKPELLITVSRKSVAAIDKIRQHPTTITTQKLKLALQLLTSVNTDYHSYVNNVTKKIFETRSQLGDRKTIHNNDILFLIDIEEDLNEFLATLQPYELLLQALLNGRFLSLYDDDRDLITDLQLSTNELIELSKSRLKTMQNIREAYTTIATNNLNRIFRLLTSISIFLMIPTLIFSMYGMNISLPGASSQAIFGIIAGVSSVLVILAVVIFRRRGWF